MFSQTILMGRLGRDPEIRTTNGGKRVATLNLCTSEYSKAKEYAEWHTVVAWGDGLVGVIEKNLHKGDAILVTGQNKTRKWEKDGVTRYTTEVVMGPRDTLKFVDVRREDKAEGQPSSGYAPDLNDEIPF